MENILQGIPNVIVRTDDILMTEPTRKSHLSTFEQVLSRLDKYCVHLKLEKCKFFITEVIYLGNKINRGVQPVECKVQAIKKAPCLTNIRELQPFFGMLNYYICYIPKISSILIPLYQLLRKEANVSVPHKN